MTRRLRRIAAAVAFSLFALASLCAYAQDVPVLAGGDPNLDACGESGEIVGLDPHGDGFLSVRSGPGGRPFFEKDRVFNGQSVTICERRGNWLGVIYRQGGTHDCGLSSPRSIRQAYTGPCRWGWVSTRYVRGVAGGIDAEGPPPANGSSCDDFYMERNGIYKDAGFCFKSERAIRTFGNAGCRYDAIEDVPLSANQRRLVEADARREREMGCSK